MSMKYLNIPFTPQEKEQIRDLAYKQSTTQTAIVLKLIRQGLKQLQEKEVVEVEQVLDIPDSFKITSYDSNNRTKSVRYEIPLASLGFATSNNYRQGN